ncbi:MAG: tetratricopeptide repeat protein, partial [Candidatus Neomarinimicrobiota bacterium]
IGRISHQFFLSLVNNGYLIVSPVEVSLALAQMYETVRFQNVTFYRRNPEAVKGNVVVGCETKPVLPLISTPMPALIRAPFTPIQRPAQSLISEVTLKAPAMDKSAVAEDIAQRYEDALIAYHKGLYLEAELILKEIINDKKQRLPVTILLAKVSANLGRLDEALRLCREALEIDKLDPMLHYLQATILAELGDQPASIAALKKTIYLDPDFVLAHFYLGNVNLQLRQASHAKRYFQNALAILSKRMPEEILSVSEGITAGRLKEIIETIQE